MRRRLSWAAVGTSGVLAAIVATTMTSQSDSDPQRGKIIVPQAEELNGYIPAQEDERPTVFIPVIPPVAATSATSTVPSPPPPAKQTPAPKPKETPPPAPPPPPKQDPEPPSYQDFNWSYWYYYGGYGNDGYRYSDRDGYHRDGYHRDGYDGRRDGYGGRR